MKVFVSYRRRDTMAQAGRLSDRLAAHFGGGSVFRDLVDFGAHVGVREAITAELQQCDVLLVLIGPQWLEAQSAGGMRSLENESDSVRHEIETAFQLGLPVVPILVDFAEMPRADRLPPSLRALTHRNAFELPPDPDYSRAVSRLIEALEALKPTQQITDRPTQPPELPDLSARPTSVFVSHSTSDRAWVEREIVLPLRSRRIETWYSRDSIETSAQWEREILKALDACDWFLLVVSPRAATSEWIKDELNWAIYNRPTRIVPVVMERADLWSFHIRLPRIQNVDYVSEPALARQKLYSRLCGDA